MAKQAPVFMKQQRKAWQGNSASKRKITGRALQRERASLFAHHPICQICREQVATIRDHILALAFGGKDTRDNTQAVCAGCHDAKSRQESIEGRVARKV